MLTYTPTGLRTVGYEVWKVYQVEQQPRALSNTQRLIVLLPAVIVVWGELPARQSQLLLELLRPHNVCCPAMFPS